MFRTFKNLKRLLKQSEEVVKTTENVYDVRDTISLFLNFISYTSNEITLTLSDVIYMSYIWHVSIYVCYIYNQITLYLIKQSQKRSVAKDEGCSQKLALNEGESTANIES